MKMLTLLILFVAALVANALTLRRLGILEADLSWILFLRGWSCLVLVLIEAAYLRLSLVPSRLRVQILRAFLASGSLLSIIASFHYASAASVSLFQRLDLVFLIFFGVGLSAEVKRFRRIMMAPVLLGFLALGIWYKPPGDSLEGYLLASLGAFGLAVGYIFLKKSQAEENGAVAIMVPALSLLAISICLFWIDPSAFPDLEVQLYSVIQGCLMYLVYKLTIALYRRLELSLAELPTLLAAWLVMPAESFFLEQSFSWKLFLLYGGLLFWLALSFLRPGSVHVPRLGRPKSDSKLTVRVAGASK